jgi:hypothetical protein
VDLDAPRLNGPGAGRSSGKRAVVGVGPAATRGLEMGVAGESLRAVPVVQHGIEAGQRGAGAEEQREQEERPDSHDYAASPTAGSVTAAPAPVRRRTP